MSAQDKVLFYVNVLVENARSSGKPVMLSTSLVNTGRTHLAHRASEVDGQLRIETGWSADCYDFSTADDADAGGGERGVVIERWKTAAALTQARTTAALTQEEPTTVRWAR